MSDILRCESFNGSYRCERPYHECNFHFNGKLEWHDDINQLDSLINQFKIDPEMGQRIVAQAKAHFEKIRAEKKSSPDYSKVVCEKHIPNDIGYFQCLACACQSLTSSLTQIAALFDPTAEPYDGDVITQYDIDCCEESLVKRLKVSKDKSLSWRDVFEYKNIYSDLKIIALISYNSGYKYFASEDKVFEIRIASKNQNDVAIDWYYIGLIKDLVK